MTLTNIWWLFSQALRSIVHGKDQFLMAIVLSGLALTIPVFVTSAAISVRSTVIDVPTQVEITAFTRRSARPNQVAAAAARIEALPGVVRVRTVGKDEALATVNESLGLGNRRSEVNPLPDIIIAELGHNVSRDTTAALAKDIEALPEIESTAYDDRWAEYRARLLQAVSLAVAILGAVILILVSLVVTHSVRMTTQARRDEIRALHIFGAGSTFITSPYALCGLITLALAAGLSLGLSWVGVTVLAEPVADFASLYGVKLSLSLPARDWCLLYVFIAAVAGAVLGQSAAGRELRRLRRAG